MNYSSTTLHEARKLRLLAAALELQHFTSTAANIVPIPGGDRVIAIGTPAQVRKLLGDAPSALLNVDEMAALRRFNETCEDGEGYDVRKEMMQRLAEIGVVRRTSGRYYEITDFGMHALDAAPLPALEEVRDAKDAAPLTRCAAGSDGECGHAQYPQLRDDEPRATGRHCPIDSEGGHHD